MNLPNTDPLTTSDAVADNNAWPLTIATYNIHGAVGTDGRFAPQRIVDVVKEVGADIVALQEVPLGGGGFPDVLHMLQDATGFEGAEGPTFQIGERIFGNAVLSRYPIVARRTVDLSVGKHEPRGALA